jgi:hypothetical protein
MIRRTYRDLFFVPAGQADATEILSHVSWLDLDDEPPAWLEVEGKQTAIYMGTAAGFDVFGKMTIPQQERARRCLGTSGGENALAILENRLVRCRSDSAYLEVLRLIADYQEAAVPIIEREIDRVRPSLRYSNVKMLVSIPGTESAALIQSLCTRADVRVEVFIALSHIPARADLSAIYSAGARYLGAEIRRNES